MYSSKITGLIELLSSADKQERDAVFGMLQSSLVSWEEAFSRAPFDSIACVIPHLKTFEDPRVVALLLPWIAAGRVEGVKKTPISLVAQTLEFLLHHIKASVQKSPEVEDAYWNHKIDLTKVVPLVRKIDDILGQLSPREYMLIENSLESELADLILQAALDSECKFADEFHCSRLVVAIIHKITVFINVLGAGPLAEQQELDLERHPFVRHDADLRLGGLWLKICITHFFPSNNALKEAMDALDETLKPFRMPSSIEITKFLLDKDFTFLEEKLVDHLKDLRRWLFFITQMEILAWNVIWKPTIKPDRQSSYVDQSIPSPNQFAHLKIPKLVKQVVRPQFLKYFEKLQPLNKM